MKIGAIKINLVISVCVLVIGVLVYVLANNSTSKNYNFSQQNSINSNDGKFSASMTTLQEENLTSCNFFIRNKETKEEVIVKTVKDTDKAVCDFYKVDSFSPDNKYIVIDYGTSPIRTLEIVNVNTKKSIAKVTSSTSYGWLNETEFLFENTVSFKKSEDMRPWGGGEGFGITKISFPSGLKTILKKADSTHDYALDVNSNGSFVGDATTARIRIITYQEEGNHRFDNPDVSYWMMNNKGILVKNVDGFNTFK